MQLSLFALVVIAAAAVPSAASAQVPPTIAAPGENAVVTLHAEGAQVYECKAGSDGKLAWAFREPIATLLLDGKTVGRHYAGPNWEHADGSAVVGKAVARRIAAPARCRASPRCSGSIPRAASTPALAIGPAPSIARLTPQITCS